MRASLGAAAILIVACGDNAAPVQLLVHAEGDATVALIAYREGGGTWRTPRALASRGHDTWYDLAVATEYEAQVVCEGTEGLTVSTVYGMRDDVNPAIGCFYYDPTPVPPTSPVTGTMEQPGQVYMDSQDARNTSSTTAPWSFTLQVPQGVHDFIAVPDPSSPVQAVVIRRAQDIESPLVEPEVDLAAEGVPLAAIPVAISGFGGDLTLASVELATEHGFALLPLGSRFEVMPSASLLPDEVQNLWVSANATAGPGSPTFERAVYAVLDEHTHIDATLLPRLDGVAITASLADDLVATWSAPPVDDYDWLAIDFGSDPRHHRIAASRGWLEAHGPSLTLHTSAPGFDPSWIPTTVPSSYFFFIDADRAGVSYSTSAGFSSGATARATTSHARALLAAAARSAR